MADEYDPLTRMEIVNRLRARLGLSARDGDLILDAFLEAVADQLEKGGAVTLSGLGRFAAKASPARTARNPGTGQAAAVPARIRPVFTLSQSLRTMMVK